MFPFPDKPAWYCLRAKTRREHIAAEHCRKLHQLPVFAPRLKVRRLMKNDQVKDFIEPLFPSYFFAFGLINVLLRPLMATPGVTGIVRSAGQYIPVPGGLIEELQAQFPGVALHKTQPPPLEPGQAVTILQGCLKGQAARVISIEDPMQRIAILLEFLGQEVVMKVHPKDIYPRTGND